MTEARAKVLKKDGKQRSGRGFSKGELKGAGLSLKDALRRSIPIDSKRGTVHEENVKALKTFLEAHKPEPKPKKKSKS
jgi:large subunit ribosomal protein L13e